MPVDEQLLLLERLAAMVRLRNLEQHDAGRPAWHDFLARTYGSLAYDPFERAPQGEYEQRDQL